MSFFQKKKTTHINTNRQIHTPTQTLSRTYMTGPLQVSWWQLECWEAVGVQINYSLVRCQSWCNWLHCFHFCWLKGNTRVSKKVASCGIHTCVNQWWSLLFISSPLHPFYCCMSVFFHEGFMHSYIRACLSKINSGKWHRANPNILTHNSSRKLTKCLLFFSGSLCSFTPRLMTVRTSWTEMSSRHQH